jgi:hypothetical protein
LTQGCNLEPRAPTSCPPNFMCRSKGTSRFIGECVERDGQKPPFGVATVGHIHD